MAEITAAAVKSLRERTGLPMMDCKKALVETSGDEEAAVVALRKKGIKTQETKIGTRDTSFGRMGVYTDFEGGKAAIVELKCESAPVAAHEEFVQLANDLARQLATGPGAETPDELFDQVSPSKPDLTLREQKDELYNRIREVFELSRILRVDGRCGAYTHHAGTTKGVLLEVEGGDEVTAKDICMHIVAMDPSAITKEDLDPDLVAKEREILTEMARKEGKPDNIIEKMIEGRMRQFYAQRVLSEQPFVKDDKQTVGAYADAAGLKLKTFISWELGKE